TVFISRASAAGAPLGGALADRLARRLPGARILVQAAGLVGGAAFVGLVARAGGAAALAAAMVTASALTGSDSYRAAAEAALARAGLLPARAPRAAGHWLTAAEALAHGPVQIAVIGQDGDPARAALETQAWRSAPGGAVTLAGEPGAEAAMLAGRDLIDGVPAAYVCHGFVCDRPVTSAEDLHAQLRQG
ncbi:MAG TPA: hypothetical protein VGI84_02325, partial [Pseudonocardiaceae bacterium]